MSFVRIEHIHALLGSHESSRNDIESITSFDFGCHAGRLLPLRHGCKGPAWHPEFLATVIWVTRVSASLAEVGSEKCQ